MNKETGRPPALQDRSLVTRDLLCDAAEDLLREGGLALCTIQDVAARSGRSAGSVYRRFGDKDGMIEAVIDRYLAHALQANETSLRTLTQKRPDLSARVKALVDGAVAGRRRDGKLIEAFREAAATSSSDALSAAFDRTRNATLELAKRALKECSAEIAHPNKARAIDFAVSILAGAIETMMRPPATLGDRVIRAELHAMLVSYLTTGAAVTAP
jgi:AcrR family transcriptional regulator